MKVPCKLPLPLSKKQKRFVLVIFLLVQQVAPYKIISLRIRLEQEMVARSCVKDVQTLRLEIPGTDECQGCVPGYFFTELPFPRCDICQPGFYRNTEPPFAPFNTYDEPYYQTYDVATVWPDVGTFIYRCQAVNLENMHQKRVRKLFAMPNREIWNQLDADILFGLPNWTVYGRSRTL